MKPNVTYNRNRIIIIFGLIVLGLLLLTGRMIYLQAFRSASLASQALNNRTHSITVEAKRGAIYDRNYKELAISIDTESVFVSPAKIKEAGNPQKTARALATLLKLDEPTVLKKIKGNSSFAWIKRQALLPNSTEYKKLKAMDLPGVYTVPESRRFYPEKEIACHVVGITGVDNVGLEGIDFYYNKTLSGTPGVLVAETDRKGNPIPETAHYSMPSQDGMNLVLTLDSNIQHVAEQELDKIWQERSPDSASIIVMDPRTGEILAMANRPNYDPNHFSDYPNKNRRNFAVNNALEPGSTGKIVTAAAALEEGVVRPSDNFYCPATIKVQDRTIHEAHNEAYGTLTFQGLMEKSSNIGFVQVGLKLGLDRYYRYVRAFGLGQKTGIDLPGEASGILVPEKSARQIDLATMAFGQANATTPIQLVAAVGAIANDGKMMRPHLVKEIRDSQGHLVKRIEPETVRQVISAETSRQLRLILENVVKEGTGERAYIAGYRVGGKTGTAQKISPNGGYMEDAFVTSFIAIAPVNTPRLVTLVIVDNPKGAFRFGATTAAPSTRAIFEYSLPYLGVLKQGQVAPAPAKKSETTAYVPDMVGLSSKDAAKKAAQHGLKVKVVGKGNRVWDQQPSAYAQVKPGSIIEIYLTNSTENKTAASLVPDVRGKSMREAAAVLKANGYIIRPQGSGLAREQNPAPGNPLASGSEVRVIFGSLSDQEKPLPAGDNTADKKLHVPAQ
ncbi:MAG: penicillin-binding transpeptidase domain-containing protein [Methylocystaceae bacterium]